MATPRRLWDSSVIIGYLAGSLEVAEDSTLIVEQAEQGELEIVVSAMATIEVAYLEGSPPVRIRRPLYEGSQRLPGM